MASITDPAREIADFCEDLYRNGTGLRGDKHIAQRLDVAEWSRDFYQIIFSVLDRIDFTASVVQQCDLDEDIKRQAVKHLKAVARVFSQDLLTRNWNHSDGGQPILKEHLQPIKMLSPTVRAKVSYPKLDESEIEELLGEIDQLTTWLEEHQLREVDFIRQTILDGLASFRFRLQRLKWLGWGYTVEGLRDLISAYLALERSATADDPQAAAMLKKLAGFVGEVFKKAKMAQEANDTVSFILAAYRTASLYATPALAGYLAHSTG